MLNRYLRALDCGATVITANARLARVIRREFDHRKRAAAEAGGPSAWPAAAIMPWGSWLESEWRHSLYNSNESSPAVLLRPSQERVIWEDVIAASEGANTLLDIPATARNAAAAWNLVHEWRLDLNDPSWEQSDDTAAFQSWARKFEARCKAENCLSDATLADSVLATVRSGTVNRTYPLFAGFDEFSPRQREVLAALNEAGIVVEVVPPLADQPRVSARRLEVSDVDSELSAAARWARAALESNPAASIAVVIPGLRAVRAKVERIFTNVLHPSAILPGESARPAAFHISLGLPLSDYPLIHAALLALECGSGPPPINLAGTLLRSPLFRGGISEAAGRALLDAELRGRRGLSVPVSVLQALAARPPDRAKSPACPVLAAMLAGFLTLIRNQPKRQSCSAWAAGFSRLLDTLGWPGERPLTSAEYQTAAKWQSSLGEFASLDAAANPLEYREAVATLRRIVGETVFQPESSEAPIQILGALESAGQQFDHLWVAGLHDAAWPAAASPNPFIPLRLQREQGLPHASAGRELAYTELLTRRLLSSAADVIVSFPRRDGDLDLRPSQLIAGLPETSLDELGIPAGESYTARQLGLAVSLERMPDVQAPPIGAGETAKGGMRIVKEQAACPFRAFAKLRLHAEPLETPQAGLTAMDRGNLVHAALETIWTALGSHEALQAAAGQELSALVRDSVAKAVRDFRANGGGPSERVLAIEARLLENLLASWLEQEKNRAPFSVLQLENREDVELSGIAMTLRADRIDRLEDGRHVLIDYKTGSVVPSPAQWDGERPDEPQLPLYAVTCGLDLAAVTFAHVKRGELRFRGRGVEAGVLPGVTQFDGEWSAQLEEWRRVLNQLAADFRNGVAAVDPKIAGNSWGKTCAYCGLQALCRISEAAAASEDEGAEEMAGAAHA